MKSIFIWLWPWLFVSTLSAQQVSISSGSGPPISTSSWYDWYLDTEHHQAYYNFVGFHGRHRWLALQDSGTLTIDVCLGLAIIFDGATYAFYNHEMKLDGGFTHWRQMDSLVIGWHDRKVVGYNASGQVSEGLFYNFGFECLGDFPIFDSLGGQLAFCAAPAALNHSWFYCYEAAAWGMWGLDGRWLIEPIYDRPFRFQNGTAEVIHYGQKRKINEQGEFVE